MTAAPLQTPLCGWHETHGGRMVDFAGWRMPVQYRSIIEEHLATRTAAGLFDVSHMGRLAVTGPGSLDWLESLLTRRVADLQPGQARYTLITADDGGMACAILDDALVTRETDAPDGTPRLALVVNASNRERVVRWLNGRRPATGVALVDRTSDTAMLAVQGPRAIDVVCGLCPPADAAAVRRLGVYRATAATVADVPAAVSRTGYTGEDGVELVVPAAASVGVWKALHAAGATIGLEPCGLGARDTLRLEAGMPLYGHELLADSDPFAIGLGLAVTLAARDGSPRRFPGAGALRAMAAQTPRRVRVGLAFDAKRPAREGSQVLARDAAAGSAAIGTVTSGSFAPTLGHAVALAVVARDFAAVGTPVDVVVRDAIQPARVVPLPFYRRERPQS